MRPYIEGTDNSPAEDIMGRLAWFFAEGFGSYDKHGKWIGGVGDHIHDLVERVDIPAIDTPAGTPGAREFTVAEITSLGLIMAEVEVSDAVRILRAWIEPREDATKRINLAEADMDSLGLRVGSEWLALRTVLTHRARATALDEAA